MSAVPARPGAVAVGRGAWLTLLALQPFNQFGALRLLAGLLLLICLLFMAARALRVRGWTPGRPDAWLVIGLLLLAWSLFVSLLGPYPLDSLDALRKGLLVQGLMVAGGWVFVLSAADLRRAVAWVLGGFALLTLLSAAEVADYWLGHGWVATVPRSHDHWWGGYGTTGAFLLPLLAGWGLLPDQRRSWRVAAGALGVLALGLVVLYGSRTPLVVMLVGVGLVLVLAGRWRWLGAAAAALVLATGLLALAPDGPLTTRYQSLLQGETYVSDAGLSARPALWQGMVEVIGERPLLGYGYGWKKLARAINDGGFAARWQAEGGSKARYFLAGGDRASGRVNPHNYFLQVIFEIGVPGLMLALLFWAALLKRGVLLITGSGTGTGRDSVAAESRALAVAICGLAAAYWLSNFTNGHWQGTLANLSLALVAGLAALATRTAAGDRRAAAAPAKKILVIRRDNIGDLVCTTPLLAALRQRFPTARIDVLANSYNAPVLAGNPDIDGVYAYLKLKHRSPATGLTAALWQRLALIVALRRRCYDDVILAAEGAQASASRFARWVAPRRVIGPPPGGGAGTHEVERVCARLAAYAAEAAEAVQALPPPCRVVPDARRVGVIAAGLPAGFAARPWVGLHLSARKPSQRWPVERFAALARELHGRYRCGLLVFWSPGTSTQAGHPGDDEMARQLLAATAGLPVALVVTAQLADLIAGLSLCDQVICSDGGAMHVAAGLGKPIVCFFGDSNAARWHPWGVPHVVLQKESRSVMDIGVEEAVGAYVQLLARLGLSGGSPRIRRAPTGTSSTSLS